MINTDTLKAIEKAFNSASDDSTRYHINHVLLKASGEQVTIVATDGFILSEVTLEDKDFAALIGEKSYIVTPEQRKLIKLMLKDKMNTIPTELTSGGIVIKSMLGYSTTLRTDKDAGIQFPDYKQVIPKYNQDTCTVIGFNPELLTELCKSLRLVDTKETAGAKLIIKDKISPIIVQVGDQSGVLMPMRI